MERDVWQNIEETELALRRLVEHRYVDTWPRDLTARVRQSIGDESWRKIQDNVKKSLKKYPYSKDKVQKGIIHHLYLGQLMILMVETSGWPLFQHLFRDKRQLQDLMSAIMPVRNDRAHFAQVPQKELDRCRIACDDLLVIASAEATRLGIPE